MRLYFRVSQNKLLRLLNNTNLRDGISTEELLLKSGLQSVNQLAANIKILEVWKSLNVKDYLIGLEPNKRGIGNSERYLRPASTRLWNQDAKTVAVRESFSKNAAKIWNNLPSEIKSIKYLYSVKMAIKMHCKTLPI